MSNELEPALSAEEWADITRYGVVVSEIDVGPFHFGTNSSDESLLALANAALPDESPYKITPEDSRFLEQIALAHAESGEYWQTRTAARLRAIALKLAALLPPKTL